MVHDEIDEINMFIANNKKHGATQSEIARRAGVTKNTISDTLNRNRVPRWDTFKKIQQAVEDIRKELNT